ncbi:hypothetical protein KUTeg_019684 [Tegillarca granosa]|uniref:Helicase C-terminal domain-containing protein n=1 Tax=Tegillarca granosa TaxID=220873 RepID=A0ABQ9ED99_TEGGR|nr:hypothetical protein KUTeg_019684 [Tegillarca granosa]
MRDFFNNNPTDDKSLDTAAILSVEGRVFPVDIHYTLDPVPDYLKSSVDTAMKIHHNEGPGDMLIFLTGQDEVENVVRLLIDEAKRLPKDVQRMKVLPMYGSLPASEQMKVFERTPRNTRKMVVATNIAETSITINGIVYKSLVIVPVSQASADQRAGRAGRVRAGKAYRLYTVQEFPDKSLIQYHGVPSSIKDLVSQRSQINPEFEEDFSKLPAATVPEMQRSDLAPVVLQMKALGISNVLRFHFLSPPPAENMVRGLELLYALGGLDDNGNLTSPLGLQMAEFPLPPMFAKMLLVSGFMFTIAP